MPLRDLVGRLLPALDGAFPTAVLDELTSFLTDAAGAHSVSMWLADYDQDVLGGLVGPSGTDVGQRVAVGEGPVGQAYATQRPVTVSEDGEARVHAPITLRGDRIGVLQVGLSGPADPDTETALAEVALTLAYVLALAPRYTDSFERARRVKPLSVAAEMQWSVLPARAFETAEFALAGRLMPAYEVGGDVYDFCADPASLWLAVTDAMGHGMQASVLAGLANHTLRNARRCGDGLVDQVAAADRALAATFGGAQFVTGVVLQVELDTGKGQLVDAGHPPPYLIRNGEVTALPGTPDVPMGLFEDSSFTAADLQLEAGDRLVVVSDGVLEGLLAGDGQYGDAELAERLAATAGLPAQQAVETLQRHLQEMVGERLHDDATFVVLDWRGSAPRTRRRD